MQETISTQQRIMDQALALFAQRGFDAVTVADIAKAVGIKAPSLYKHFASKQAIFDAILTEMENRYEQQTASMRIDGRDPEKDVEFYRDISEDTLVAMGKDMFHHFLHDEYESKVRRLLSIERMGNSKLAAVYEQRYIEAPLSYQTRLFSMLIGAGLFIPADPAVMALEFYAPLLLLLNVCDAHPEREPDADKAFETHIRQFAQLYTNPDRSAAAGKGKEQ